MQNNEITLGYWAIRGLAQPSKDIIHCIFQLVRFFLNYVGLQFTDVRYSNRDDWFVRDKPSFNDKMVNLPYLKIGDKAVFESDAIYYAIAVHTNRLELLGGQGCQLVRVAQMRSIGQEMKGALVGLFYDKTNHETRKAGVLENVAKKLAIFEEILSKDKFITGETITYVDFSFWENVDTLLAFDKATVEQFPNILAYHQRFLEIPENKAYASRADYIAKPYNNPASAAWY